MPDVLEDVDPRQVDAKDLDPRISYDQAENKWIFEDPDTNEGFEFNDALERWIPLSFTSEEKLTEAQKEIQEKKKQKLQQLKEEKQNREKTQQQTAVYVSKLPADVDLTELKQIFSKYGIIAEDLLAAKPKIKLYTDEEGNFKGDALVVYLKPESVDLAIQMLDGTKLRVNGEDIKVQKAEFKKKSDEENKGTKRQLSEEERQTIKKRLKALNEKAEDWNGDDDTINPKWLRTVIIKRAFTLKELAEDPLVIEDVKEDMQDGCEEIGAVEKVIVFDQEEEGVVMVRFFDGNSAVKCIEVSNKTIECLVRGY